MKKLILTIVLVTILAMPSFAAVKIRDLADVQGIRDNQLFGYGLVVGLNGSGDKQQTEFTRRLFDELKNSLTAEQEEKLIVLMEEMGVLFAISLFHNLKKF